MSGIPTVDQRWLILPRYTQPSLDAKLLIEKTEIATAEPAATASCGAKRELRIEVAGPSGRGVVVVKTLL